MFLYSSVASEVFSALTTTNQGAAIESSDQSEAKKLSYTYTQTDRESTYCQALLYEQRLQKNVLSLLSLVVTKNCRLELISQSNLAGVGAGAMLGKILTHKGD